MTARGNVLAWLGHPVTVAAVVVLAVNDRLLKAAYPGLVTGKLSDVAGLVVAPALLATLVSLAVPRLPSRAVALGAIAATGAGFTLTKATAAGAALASAAWSVIWPSHVRADLTDLLALPALALAWWVWRRTHDAPVPERAVRLFRVCVALPIAALAVAGTSAVHYPSVARVWVDGDRLAAGTVSTPRVDAYEGLIESKYTSADGTTWVYIEPSQGLVAQSPRSVTTRACVPAAPQRCFRVVEGRLAVDESTDGGRTWRRAWEVSEGRRSFLARRLPEAKPSGTHLVSAELAMLPVGDGFVVAVANRRDGLAVRRADGTWVRTWPTGDEEPHALTARGQHVVPEYILGVLAGVLVMGAVALGVSARRRWYLAGGTALAVLGLGLMSLALWAYVFSVSEIVVLGGFSAAVAGAGIWIFGVVTNRGVRWWHPLVAMPAAVATGIGVGAPFYGWSAGDPDSYGDAGRQASIAAAAGLVVAAVIVGVTWLARRQQAQQN